MHTLKGWVCSHKKQTIAIAVVLALILCAGIAVAVIFGGTGEEYAPVEGPVKIDFSAGDLKGIVTGLEGESYVSAGGTLDLLSLLTYDDSIVIKVTANELDLSAAANLEAEYTFTVDAKALCEALGREFPENGMAESVIVATKKIIVTDSAPSQQPEASSSAASQSTGAAAKPDNEAASSHQASNLAESKNPPASSEIAGNDENANHGASAPGGELQNPSGNTESGEEPHVHTWVFVSPENSWHMEYGAECRIHGYNGEEPMFFRTQNDLFLHHAADGCTSSWGAGFKGLAYKYCSGCREEVIIGHVHDFGTIAKEIYSEKVVCECGMAFNAGQDYTALDSWNTHVETYTGHGEPREEHDSYQIAKTSVTRYEATKTCACGWRPVDNSPVY